MEGTNVVTVLDEVGGEGMAEAVAVSWRGKFAECGAVMAGLESLSEPIQESGARRPCGR